MNRKIELVKRKKARQTAQAELIQNQINSSLELKTAIDGLYEAINDKESLDYDKLYDQLRQIDKRLDLAPLFKSLERSIKTTSNDTPPHKTKIEGFSELLKAVKSLKDNPPIVNVKADLSQEYKASDADITTIPSYFGFIHPTGKWYIMRQSGANLTMFRYVSGTKGYRKAWDSRASLDYGLYSEVRL